MYHAKKFGTHVSFFSPCYLAFLLELLSDIPLLCHQDNMGHRWSPEGREKETAVGERGNHGRE